MSFLQKVENDMQNTNQISFDRKPEMVTVHRSMFISLLAKTVPISFSVRAQVGWVSQQPFIQKPSKRRIAIWRGGVMGYRGEGWDIVRVGLGIAGDRGIGGV